MSTPTRKPDFSAIHPDKLSFEKALAKENEISATMKSHADSLPEVNFNEVFSSAAPEMFTDSSRRTIESFSTRRFNDYLFAQMQSKIVPGAAGKIDNILITVPTQTSTGSISISNRHERHYKSLIKGLGENRRYTIVCHPDNRAQIEGWLSALNNVDVDFALSPRFNYSIWAQDAYVGIMENTGKSILAEGISFPRYEDMTIADDVAYQTSTAVFQSYMYFQGGNVLGGPTETFIGKDYIWRNTNRAGLETEADVISAFEKIFGTKIRVLGGRQSADYNWLDAGILSGYGQQPLFHIDMYVTPTGVLGPSGKEIVFLGRPSKAHEVVGLYSELPQFDNSQIDDFFNETEQQLSSTYEVRHLPLLLTYGDLNGNASRKDFYYLTFNNVVIESYDDNGTSVQNVIMTTYSQDSSVFTTDKGIREDLENAAEQEWKNAGFTVHRMDGMEELAYGLGSIHCITKALSRSSNILLP